MKTVALFGGSFDPPHLGHIAIVDRLKALDYIDRIIIMPTYLNPFKSDFCAPAHLRLAWLKKIFQGETKVEVSSFEVDMGRKVPTIESVEYLLQKYDQIYVVIGADNLASLKQWKEYERLQKLVKFIVATRNNIPVDDFITLSIQHDISSTQLRQHIDVKYLPKICATEIYNYYKDFHAKKN